MKISNFQVKIKKKVIFQRLYLIIIPEIKSVYFLFYVGEFIYSEGAVIPCPAAHESWVESLKILVGNHFEVCASVT